MTGTWVLPLPSSAEKSVIISLTIRGSPSGSGPGQWFAGHPAKRALRALAAVFAIFPGSTGTQSAGPTGGDGSGQSPLELSWYGVWQPLMIAVFQALAPVASQSIAVVRLPPVRRSATVLADCVRSSVPLTPTVTENVCEPGVAE